MRNGLDSPVGLDPDNLLERTADADHHTPPVTLGKLLLTFLRVGAMGFGGGIAIIALMEQEFVRKLRVISDEDFVAGVGLSQLLGAFPVNTAVFVGYRSFGLIGAALSVGALLLPSLLMVLVLSAVYFNLHEMPDLQHLVGGLTPVVIALILSVSWTLGRKVAGSWREAIIGATALLLGFLEIHPLWVLLSSGLVGYYFLNVGTVDRSNPTDKGKASSLQSLAAVWLFQSKVPALVSAFLKVGLLFFGGGFVLIPMLRTEIVVNQGWLTPNEFLDGIAISSLTPGPIAEIATFVGYKQAGIIGALLATVALLAPGTLLMMWISHSYSRLGQYKWLPNVMAGINSATVGLILSSALLMGRQSLITWVAVLFCALSLFLLARLRWQPGIVLALGALLGYLGWL